MRPFTGSGEGGFASASEAGSCYNIGRNEIYYFNRDSLFVYNMETGNISAKAFTERCPVKLFLAGSFFDSASERLYVYEVLYREWGCGAYDSKSRLEYIGLESRELQSAQHAVASSLFLL